LSGAIDGLTEAAIDGIKDRNGLGEAETRRGDARSSGTVGR